MEEDTTVLFPAFHDDGTAGLALYRGPDTDNEAFASSAGTIQMDPIPENIGAGKTVVILGAGVGGLITAYKLLQTTLYTVVVVEAEGRVGGRSLTLRDGDQVVEHAEGQRKPWIQTCNFRQEKRDENGICKYTGKLYKDCEGKCKCKAYLNAGPGRLPSGHKMILSLCKELKVELEVYIKESRSNVHYSKDHTFKDEERVNRRIGNDTRGHIAELLHKYIERDQKEANHRVPLYPADVDIDNLKDLLANFGALTRGKQKDGEETTKYNGSTRSGYKKLPGTRQGQKHEPLQLKDLVASKFWKRRFYQVEDWLWQSTSFQPVGGMDQIEIALEKAIRGYERGRVVLNATVTKVEHLGGKWNVHYTPTQENAAGKVAGDICVSNIPIPLLLNKIQKGDFTEQYYEAVETAATAKEFFQPTTKVGWQAEREYWQLPSPKGTIPIYGGISYTSDKMSQMWYPSDDFHATYGMLTGAYNMEEDAREWGRLEPGKRLDNAIAETKNLHGADFSKHLEDLKEKGHGVAIAWQNIKTVGGGWCNWNVLNKDEDDETGIKMLDRLLCGDNNFYITGDQVSELPGWKEGAYASAMNVVGQICVPGFHPQKCKHLPDTNALVDFSTY